MLELVIVMSLVGILAAIAIPRYASTTARFKAGGAATRIAADMRMAQRRARLTGASVKVAFDTVNQTYTLQGVPDPDDPTLTYKVDLAEDPYNAVLGNVSFNGDGQVIYDGYGMPDSGGSLNLQVGEVYWSIVLDSRTGSVSTIEVENVPPPEPPPLEEPVEEPEEEQPPVQEL